jgi:hypothetical protein
MNQAFSVIKKFEAKEPISGRDHQFELGDRILCDTGQEGPTIAIELEWSLFFLERSVFKDCCRWKNEGGTI